MQQLAIYLFLKKSQLSIVIVVFTVLLLNGINGVYGQNTGFVGKKFIIKTNVVNGIRLGLNNVELEHVFARRLSINAEFEYLKYGRGEKGVSVKTGNINSGRRQLSEKKEISTLSGGTTKGWLGKMGCKFYFNRILPAPIGFYTSFTLGFGIVQLENYTVAYEYKKKAVSLAHEEDIKRPAVTGLDGASKILFFEVPSMGYQRVYHKILVLDAKISMQSQYCPLPDSLRNALEHNYYVRSNLLSYGRGNFSVGLAVYVKIGLLLF